ncbi:MAG: alpha/beta hydrolase, partial [Pseudomonadota bacterium]
MRLLFAFATVLICAACVRSPDRIAFAEAAASASVQQIYVTTSSVPSTEPVDNLQDRNAQGRLARFDVSIPPTHQLSQIEWPDDAVNPATDFAVVGQEDLGSNGGFSRELPQWPGNDAALFVYGYNSTSSKALYRLAQVRYDFQIDAFLVLFAWPSVGRLEAHLYNRDSVLFAPRIAPEISRSQANSVGDLRDPFIIMTNQDHSALNLSVFNNIARQSVGDVNGAADIAGFDIPLFDFTALADGSNRDHLAPFASPAAISVL